MTDSTVSPFEQKPEEPLMPELREIVNDAVDRAMQSATFMGMDGGTWQNPRLWDLYRKRATDTIMAAVTGGCG